MIMNSPEPMNLGSPSQSPPINQYMPQFLLGDLTASTQSMQLRNQSQIGSKYWVGSNSPPRGNNGPNSAGYNPNNGGVSLTRNYSISSGYDSKLSNPNLVDRSDSNFMMHHYGHYPSGGGYSPHQDRSFGSTTIMGGNIGGEKAMPGAPPVNRLADMVNKPSMSNTTANTTAYMTPSESRNKFNNEYYSSAVDKNDLSFTPNTSCMNQVSRLSPSSPQSSQLEAYYTFGADSSMLSNTKSGDERLDDTWITVFGFSPSATSYVLQEFSIYGQIVRHVPTAQGNWIHIQYQTKLQAQKALSKTGKVLANSMMIGVMPCIDKKIMSIGNPTININNDTAFNGAAPSAHSPTSKVPGLAGRNFTNNVASKLERSQSLRTNARPLGPFNGPREQSNLASATTDSIDSSKLPKKNTNVISKAMEYMFGW